MPVPSYSINWDDLLSSTLNNMTDVVYDNAFGSDPFWAKMHMNGKKEVEFGGAKIQRTVEYAQNSTVRAMNGYSPIDLTPQEHLTEIVEEFREVAGSVSISKREEIQNRGEHQQVALLSSKIKNLGKSFATTMGRMLLVPSGSSLTAGTDGMTGATELLPLSQIVSGAANTVHSVSGSTYTWWDNTRDQANSSNNTAQTWTAFKTELTHQYLSSGVHNEGFPDLVLTSLAGYEKYIESMQSQVRYGSTEMADMGFRTVALEGAELIWDRRCPGTSANAAAFVNYDSGSYAEENFYFLNTDYLYLVVQGEADMVQLPFQQSQNQLARSAIVYFMGQLICTNRRTQRVLYGVDVSAITG